MKARLLVLAFFALSASTLALPPCSSNQSVVIEATPQPTIYECQTGQGEPAATWKMHVLNGNLLVRYESGSTVLKWSQPVVWAAPFKYSGCDGSGDVCWSFLQNDVFGLVCINCEVERIYLKGYFPAAE
jgi:hypothetical protein